MRPITITALATYIVAKNQEEKQEAEHGVFDVSHYTHEQQMAMLVMRFNDPLARAVLMRLHHSTVAGRDFLGLVNNGLAVRNSRGYHDFTPRGRWISRKVTEYLAKTFEVKVPRAPRVYSREEQIRYSNAKLNWMNR